ncbi:hypothetical protein BS78_04G038700 [Paspalum vaginatum]|nr:hypothetical protein BS78_04G038700 [Paspalum vaginatum]
MSYVYYGNIPDRRHGFIDFTGEGFIIGLATSSAFHFAKGLHGSPSGSRLAGGAEAVLTKAPRFAGLSGAYSAVLFSLDTAMSVARRKEDDWNSIAAGAAGVGLFKMRRGGARGAALGALIGAACVAVPMVQCWFLAQWHVTRPYVRMYAESRYKI